MIEKYGYRVTSVAQKDMKPGEIYICEDTDDNDNNRVDSLMKCTGTGEWFVNLYEYKILRGDVDPVHEWDYSQDQELSFRFYHVSKEEHPEEYL